MEQVTPREWQGVREFVGPDQIDAFWEFVRGLDWRWVSPGAISGVIGCTRQYVGQLVKAGRLRAVVYRKGPGKPAAYMFLSREEAEEYVRLRGARGMMAEELALDEGKAAVL